MTSKRLWYSVEHNFLSNYLNKLLCSLCTAFWFHFAYCLLSNLTTFWRCRLLEAFHFLWWKWIVWSDFILFSDKWYNKNDQHSADHSLFLPFFLKKHSEMLKEKNNFLKKKSSQKKKGYFLLENFKLALLLEFGHIHLLFY